jgi:hypothetical protein
MLAPLPRGARRSPFWIQRDPSLPGPPLRRSRSTRQGGDEDRATDPLSDRHGLRSDAPARRGANSGRCGAAMFGHDRWRAIYAKRRAGLLNPEGARIEYVRLYAEGLLKLGYRHVQERQITKEGAGGSASAPPNVHRWPSGTRLQTDQTPFAALPHRRGGPDQSPQAPLRAGPIPPFKATRAGRSGLSGGSCPTTSTPSPSEPGETLPSVTLHKSKPIHVRPAARDHSAAVSYLRSLSAASGYSPLLRLTLSSDPALQTRVGLELEWQSNFPPPE